LITLSEVREPGCLVIQSEQTVGASMRRMIKRFGNERPDLRKICEEWPSEDFAVVSVQRHSKSGVRRYP